MDPPPGASIQFRTPESSLFEDVSRLVPVGQELRNAAKALIAAIDLLRAIETAVRFGGLVISAAVGW